MNSPSSNRWGVFICAYQKITIKIFKKLLTCPWDNVIYSFCQEVIPLGYKVKWVEEHLGITRKAIRVFEKAGLIPENQDGKYRDYDEDDIDRLWAIRVLQGMGYTIKEIGQMITDEEFEFDNSLLKKIRELEEEKNKIERHLGYAKTIKMTGRFPARPAKMGETKFEDFQQQAIDNWNILDDPQALEYQKIVESVLSKTPEEFDDSDIGRMFSFFEEIAAMDVDRLLIEYVLPKAIAKRKILGPDHPDIQLMIKIIYENQAAIIEEHTFSKKFFSRYYSSSYICGDIAKMKFHDFTEEERLFIAESVAVFGGYESYDALVEEEAKHGR